MSNPVDITTEQQVKITLIRPSRIIGYVEEGSYRIENNQRIPYKVGPISGARIFLAKKDPNNRRLVTIDDELIRPKGARPGEVKGLAAETDGNGRFEIPMWHPACVYKDYTMNGEGYIYNLIDRIPEWIITYKTGYLNYASMVNLNEYKNANTYRYRLEQTDPKSYIETFWGRDDDSKAPVDIIKLRMFRIDPGKNFDIQLSIRTYDSNGEPYRDSNNEIIERIIEDVTGEKLDYGVNRDVYLNITSALLDHTNTIYTLDEVNKKVWRNRSSNPMDHIAEIIVENIREIQIGNISNEISNIMVNIENDPDNIVEISPTKSGPWKSYKQTTFTGKDYIQPIPLFSENITPKILSNTGDKLNFFVRLNPNNSSTAKILKRDNPALLRIRYKVPDEVSLI